MRKKGFTLIELLVGIGIIGVLSAIALSQFDAYKTKSFDLLARSDLRNAANAEEGYFVNFTTYRSCSNDGCVSGPEALEGLESINPFSTLLMFGTATSFTGSASHSRGTGVTYSWDSAGGGMRDQ